MPGGCLLRDSPSRIASGSWILRIPRSPRMSPRLGPLPCTRPSCLLSGVQFISFSCSGGSLFLVSNSCRKIAKMFPPGINNMISTGWGGHALASAGGHAGGALRCPGHSLPYLFSLYTLSIPNHDLTTLGLRPLQGEVGSLSRQLAASTSGLSAAQVTSFRMLSACQRISFDTLILSPQAI